MYFNTCTSQNAIFLLATLLHRIIFEHIDVISDMSTSILSYYGQSRRGIKLIVHDIARSCFTWSTQNKHIRMIKENMTCNN